MQALVKPWGEAPTPLLPKVLVARLGREPAPPALRKLLGQVATLQDACASVWREVDSVDRKCLLELVKLVTHRRRAIRHLRIGSGAPLAVPLAVLPWSPRTRNCVCSVWDELPAAPLYFEDVLSLPGIGLRSAIEFACVIEAAELVVPEAAETLVSEFAEVVAPEPAELESTAENQAALSDIRAFFRLLAAWAEGERRLPRLGAVLPPAETAWPDEVKAAWSVLTRLETGALSDGLAAHYSVPRLLAGFLDELDARQLDILRKRLLATDGGLTLQELGEEFEVTRERIRQLEESLRKRLETRILKTERYAPLLRCAKALGERLGTALPASSMLLPYLLGEAVEGFASTRASVKTARLLLLWLAGPYTEQNGWLMQDRELPRKVKSRLAEIQRTEATISRERVREILAGYGIHEVHHRNWLAAHVKLVRIGDGMLLSGSSVLVRLLSVLRHFRKPMSTEEMLACLEGERAYSVRSVRQQLIESADFWRVDVRGRFVPADTEGYLEYTTISDALEREIRQVGGWAKVERLVARLHSLHGVPKTSVISYLHAPKFRVDADGYARLCSEEEWQSPRLDPSQAPACYASADGGWCWRIRVDEELLRGSGRSLPNAFAQLLGCRVGQAVQLSSPAGKIRLSWPETAITGAAIGSLRKLLEHHGGAVGDWLFIRSGRPPRFSLLREAGLRETASPLVRLALLVGGDECAGEEEALRRLAVALELEVEGGSDEELFAEARRKLLARQETELAELLPGAE